MTSLYRSQSTTMVTGEVVIRYSLLDEILADLVAEYFFQSSDFPRLWRTKKFRTFVHYVLDEMYLLKKWTWSTPSSRSRAT